MLNQSKYAEIFICCLPSFLNNTANRKKTFKNMAMKPSITMLPSKAGNGMAALLFPLCRIPSSTILNMAEIIKQMLQMKTIFENIRMWGVIS